MDIKPKDVYDNEHYYKTTILPKIRELQVLCMNKHMPMFVTVATKNNQECTKYNSEMVLGLSGTELKDNRIAQLLLYLNDFETQLPKNVLDAVQEIKEYVQKLEIAKIESGQTDITLYKDMIYTMNRIVSGGDSATFSKGMFSDNPSDTPVDDDLDIEI